VTTNVVLFPFRTAQPSDAGVGYYVFGVVYTVLAIGGSIGAAVLLVRRVGRTTRDMGTIAQPDSSAAGLRTRLILACLLLPSLAQAGDRLVFVQALQQGIGGVDGIEIPWSAAVSPDGANVYVAGWESYAIAVFRRDATTGALEFVEKKENGVDG